MPEQNETPVGIIVFRVEDQELCFDIKYLIEVLRPIDLEAHRPSRAGNKHRVDFNGEHYFLIDLTSLFGTKDHVISGSGRILLVEYGEHRIAFMVDAVTQIISGTASKDGPFRFVQTEDAPNCLGYYEIQIRKLWRIDLESLIKDSPSFRRGV